MGKQGPRLGSRVRGLRRERGLTQVELARRLEISASYLNLIEHDQRSLTAPLLLRLAGEFGLDLEDFSLSEDDELLADLHEVFSDPLMSDEGAGAAELHDVIGISPAVARAIVRLYRGYRETQQSADMLASKIYADQEVPGLDRTPLPSEEVSDFIQRKDNYFSELEGAAERLRSDAGFEQHDLANGLVSYLAEVHRVEVAHGRGPSLRRYDPKRRRLLLSDAIAQPTRTFQLAAQVALLEHDRLLDRLSGDPEFRSDRSQRLARVVLANYFAGAVLMPYQAMLEAARRERYDIELLGHRFGASFEQVCHRLCSLRRPGAQGVPFHMIRVDVAGNISKRFSASGIRFARFAGACPRWNVFSAFLTPGVVRVQLSVMQGAQAYFCVARTSSLAQGGFRRVPTIQSIGLGCRIEHAKALVYSDGVDLDALEGAVPVGVTCRLCERTDCEQRAFPAIRQPLEVDENVRGPSFYTIPRE